MSAQKDNIVVVGGGLVGAATALGLAAAGHNVTVVEGKAPERQQGLLGVDIRSVAINPRSQMLLERLGAWDETRTAPYDHMHVWEDRGCESIDFHANELGRDQLGWLVEMSRLVVGLWEKLADRCERVVDTVDQVVLDQSVQLCMGSREIVCDFLIAADGGYSAIRRALAVPVVERAVGQVALATVVRTAGEHENTAWQRFLLDGPLALLPCVEPDLVSIVWTQSASSAEARLQMSDAAFMRDLGVASEFCLGEIVEVDRRLVFPLRQQYIEQPLVDNRVLFVGDAARLVHPLAGLGVNLGFEDVDALLAVAESADTLCRPEIWRRYTRRRTQRAKSMIRLFEGINQLYGTADPGIALLRNWGVGAVNRARPVKHQIVREAMGLGPLADFSG